MRPIRLRQVHIYLGGLLFLPILVTVITGMILGFHDALLFSRPPYRLSLPNPSQQESLDLILGRLKESYSAESLDAIFLSTAPNQSLRIKLKNPKTQNLRVLFLNPESGEILADQDHEKPRALEWVYKIHRGIWAGFPGKVFVSLFGLLLFLIWPIGGVIRWRRKYRLPVPARTQKRPIKNSMDFHRWLGFYFGGVVSFMGLSGALINFPADLIRSLDPLPPSQIVPTDPGKTYPFHMDRKVALATSLHPNSRLISIHFPRTSQPAFLFYFEDNSRIYLGSQTDQVEKIMTPFSHWIHALYPIHSGRIFGSWSKYLILIIGIGILTLFVAGAYCTRTGRRVGKFLYTRRR